MIHFWILLTLPMDWMNTSVGLGGEGRGRDTGKQQAAPQLGGVLPLSRHRASLKS